MNRTSCPICGKELKNGCCLDCGYDESEDFLNGRTLAPVPKVVVRRSPWVSQIGRLSGTRTKEKSGPAKKPAAIVASGSAGPDLNWTLDAEGTLTISGKGAMTDYSLETVWNRKIPPWYDKRDNIRKITLRPGVTTVGSFAFDGCKALAGVELPESVTQIGTNAFRHCSSLKDAGLPRSLTSIGEGAFSSCVSLTGVTIPDGVKRIEGWAFSNCSALTGVTIPEAIPKIDGYAFYCCDNLRDVHYAGAKSGRELQETNNWETVGNDAFFNARWHYAK